MTAAPNLSVLYDFENNFDAALLGWANAVLNPVNCPAFTMFSFETTKMPSVEIGFFMGPYALTNGVAHVHAAALPAMVDFFEASFKITANGRRVDKNDPMTYLRAIHSNLELRGNATPNLNTFLQWYEILTLDHQGTQRAVNKEDRMDIAEATYQIRFCIPQAAFPAGVI